MTRSLTKSDPVCFVRMALKMAQTKTKPIPKKAVGAVVFHGSRVMTVMGRLGGGGMAAGCSASCNTAVRKLNQTDTQSETQVWSGVVWSSLVRVRLVEFGLKSASID